MSDGQPAADKAVKKKKTCNCKKLCLERDKISAESRKGQIMKRTILIAFVLVLTGCQKEARATLAETYFPLNVGNSWTYTNGTEELTFTIIGTEEIDGHTYYIFNDHWNIFPPVPGEGLEPTIRFEILFRYDSVADRVIMCPREGTPQVIRYDFTGDEWNPGFAIGWSRMTQSGVTCNVPAGEFSDCVTFGFGASGTGQSDYFISEYLAPNIGTIKFTRSALGTFELQSYTIVPEPATLLLLGLGGLLLRKRN